MVMFSWFEDIISVVSNLNQHLENTFFLSASQKLSSDVLHIMHRFSGYINRWDLFLKQELLEDFPTDIRIVDIKMSQTSKLQALENGECISAEICPKPLSNTSVDQF